MWYGAEAQGYFANARLLRVQGSRLRGLDNLLLHLKNLCNNVPKTLMEAQRVHSSTYSLALNIL